MADELPGILVVLSGPSGVGKTTVAAELIKRGGYARSISVTTRPMRANEIEGRDYFFVSSDRFERLKTRGELVEYAEVHGNEYGTPRAPLKNVLAAGDVMLLVIDVEGGSQVKKQDLDALLVFLVPPGQAELVRRLGERGTENKMQQTARLKRADMELDRARELYDHMVVNKDLTRCVDEVDSLVQAARQKLKQRADAGERLYPGL